jgi:hypothetical protein
MAWTTDTLDRFKKITGFNYQDLLTRFYNFNTDKKQKIYDYYNGVSTVADGEAFSQLDKLRTDFDSAISIVSFNKESFVLYDAWELFSELEDINSKLDTIYNSSKFLRSAISLGNFNPSPLIEVTLGNNQTLERLAKDLKSQDPQNDWTKIFLNNQLTEESYTADGGAILQVSFQGSDPLILTSVVDNIDSAEKTFGLDIQAKLEYEDNDLKVLTYKETLLQTVGILSSLTKGSVPEFPEQGVDKRISVGSTFGSLTFPVIFRQLYQNFTTDDSFKEFSITDLSRDGDSLLINYQVRTRTDEIQSGTLAI